MRLDFITFGSQYIDVENENGLSVNVPYMFCGKLRSHYLVRIFLDYFIQLRRCLAMWNPFMLRNPIWNWKSFRGLKLDGCDILGNFIRLWRILMLRALVNQLCVNGCIGKINGIVFRSWSLKMQIRFMNIYKSPTYTSTDVEVWIVCG